MRKTLAERLLRSDRALAFTRDLSAACGVPMRFADPLGREWRPPGFAPDPPVCAWMRKNPARAHLCAEAVNSVLAMAAEKPACLRCPMGLREAAVPLRLGPRIFGYLLLGQAADVPPDRPNRLNTWRHALERRGLEADRETMLALAREAQVIDEARFTAVLRIAEWGAQQLSAIVGEGLREEIRSLPGAVEKARRIIRATALSGPVTLPSVAAAVGLTPQHLSTLFHRSTGLRFTEQITRVRVDEACRRLAGSDAPVTEIAFAAGFQSLSRFNRAFRAVTGMNPRDYRAKNTAPGGGDLSM
ncbi:MAG: helix-turn-helix domain-containing protein [Opitutales bacterium]|nr:helix-turn-helix domain-containing protein [Opitutales bacterium]